MTKSLRYKNLDMKNENHGRYSFGVLDMIMKERPGQEGRSYYHKMKEQIEEYHNLYMTIMHEIRELGDNKRKNNKMMDIRRIADMHKAHYNAIAIDYFLYLVNPDYTPFYGVSELTDAEANIRTLAHTAETMLMASGTYEGFQTILWWNGGIEAKDEARRKGTLTLEDDNSTYLRDDETYWREDLGIIYL